jgi:hypothetical protein
MSRFVPALALAVVLVPAAAAQRATPIVTGGPAASGANGSRAAAKQNPVVPSEGTGPLVIVGVVPGPAAAPRTVHFTLTSRFAGNVTSWQVVFGDGKQANGKGALPASVAHTYARSGTFRAYVVLSEATADRYTRLRIPAEGLPVSIR